MGNPFGYGSYYGQAGSQQSYSSSPTKAQGFGDMPSPAQGQAPQQPIGYAGTFPIMPDQFGPKNPQPVAQPPPAQSPDPYANVNPFLKKFMGPNQQGQYPWLGSGQTQAQQGGYFGLQTKPKDDLGKMDLSNVTGDFAYGAGIDKMDAYGKPGVGWISKFLSPWEISRQVRGIDTSKPFATQESGIQNLWNQLQAYKEQYMPAQQQQLAGQYNTDLEKLRSAYTTNQKLVDQPDVLTGYQEVPRYIPGSGIGGGSISTDRIPIYSPGSREAQAQEAYGAYMGQVQSQEDYLQAAYNDLVNRYRSSGAFGLLG